MPTDPDTYLYVPSAGREMSQHNRSEQGFPNQDPTAQLPTGGGDSGGGGGGGTGPVGPAYRSSIGSTSNSVGAPPSIFDGYTGPSIDQAKTITRNYLALIGYPAGIDTENMALSLLQNNLQSRPGDAFDYLYNSSYLTDSVRQANPWAKFGLDADTYHQTVTNAKDMVKEITGMNIDVQTMGKADEMQALLQNIIKGNWSQKEVMDAFQSGSFTSTFGGETKDLTHIASAQPWLATGQTYQQEAQQYSTIYGAPPVNTDQLASWFRFNRGAASLGPWYSQKVSEQAAGPKVLTEVR